MNGPEIAKLATMTVHPALRQRLYAGNQYNDENHSIIEWLMAACCMVWPNQSDIPLHTGMWSSMENLQNYICELGVREAIYEDAFDGPDLVKFSAGMGDLILQQAQALGIFDPTLPAELDVHVTQDGFGWGLWQRQSSVRTPIGFWFQVWHGAKERYNMIEKQLLAAYSALQAVEPITQTAEVIVKTTLQIQGWVKDLTHLPKTGVAQAQTVA